MINIEDDIKRRPRGTATADVLSVRAPKIRIKVSVLVYIVTCNASILHNWCRVKTYPRTTMGHGRLNRIAVFHVHRELLDSVDVTEVATKFPRHILLASSGGLPGKRKEGRQRKK